jgi:hypothetical protein
VCACILACLCYLLHDTVAQYAAPLCPTHKHTDPHRLSLAMPLMVLYRLTCMHTHAHTRTHVRTYTYTHINTGQSGCHVGSAEPLAPHLHRTGPHEDPQPQFKQKLQPRTPHSCSGAVEIVIPFLCDGSALLFHRSVDLCCCVKVLPNARGCSEAGMW